MPVPVQLKEILEGMELQSDDLTAYLHRPSGRVIAISDEALASAQEGPEGIGGVDEFELADAHSVLNNPDDYVQLPDRFEIDEYRMMEHFAAGLADPLLRAECQDALHGRGAFRRFKDAMRGHGLADDWYGYRDRGYEAVARAWCEEHNIVLKPAGANA